MGGCASKSKYTVGDGDGVPEAYGDPEVKVEANSTLHAEVNGGLDVKDVPYIDGGTATLGDRTSILEEESPKKEPAAAVDEAALEALLVDQIVVSAEAPAVESAPPTHVEEFVTKETIMVVESSVVAGDVVTSTTTETVVKDIDGVVTTETTTVVTGDADVVVPELVAQVEASPPEVEVETPMVEVEAPAAVEASLELEAPAVEASLELDAPAVEASLELEAPAVEASLEAEAAEMDVSLEDAEDAVTEEEDAKGQSYEELSGQVLGAVLDNNFEVEADVELEAEVEQVEASDPMEEDDLPEENNADMEDAESEEMVGKVHHQDENENEELEVNGLHGAGEDST